jgi:hypothetical protein
MLHKTLVLSAVLGTQDFEDQIRKFYSAEELDTIAKKIADLRKESNMSSDSPSALFSVPLRNLDMGTTPKSRAGRIDQIRESVQEAIITAMSFKEIIRYD